MTSPTLCATPASQYLPALHQAREMAVEHERRQVAIYGGIMAGKRNIDVIEAALRCYTAGTSGTEEIRGR